MTVTAPSMIILKNVKKETAKYTETNEKAAYAIKIHL